MSDYKISFGDDEEYTRAYMESKGWLSVLQLTFEGKVYHLNFYDPVRLAQCIETEMKDHNPCFFEENLIVIKSITEKNIRGAIEAIIANGQVSNLISQET